ncbi:DUF805 domain-containing protein [Pseudoduganella plicata]|uniref:DUF805 domain-containing protein n=1 Tax=Pseudoduganella plicata TaxID=321984 RepID=A0A4P7BJ01_9BURK|nr:DUF805 domain-containing protein [Pseudoduganella plicata]QBQ38127.1 DUF805 domain-containing protein [Pseudoduganella plicata]GGZ02723.1 hypothetical protein GCM10007388_40430 [Pseudoduganella plicata]
MIDSQPAETPVVGAAFSQPRPFAASGRIGRVRYLAYGFVGMFLVMLAAAMLGGVVGTTGASEQVSGAMVQIVVGSLVLALTLILARRRLNDMGRTGWWGLLLLVPLLNFIATAWLVFGKGDDGANAYGPPPAPNSRGAIVLACIGPVLFVGVMLYSGVDAYRTYVDRATPSRSQTF